MEPPFSSDKQLNKERVAFKKVSAFVSVVMYLVMSGAFFFGIIAIEDGWTWKSICKLLLAVAVCGYCFRVINDGQGIFRHLTTLEQSLFHRQSLEEMKEQLRTGRSGMFWNGVEMELENGWLVPKKNGRKIVT